MPQHEEEIAVSAIRPIAPFVMAPHWLLTSKVSDTAFRVYCILRAHLNEQTGEEVYPSKEAIAAILGMKKASSLDPHIKQLVAIGAVVVIREQKGPRRRNRYGIATDPPKGTFTSLAEWYKNRKEQLRANTTPPKTDVGNPKSAKTDVGYIRENGYKLEPLLQLEPLKDRDTSFVGISSSELASQDSDAAPGKEVELSPQRQDVEQACALLAELIEANGSKKPKISSEWRKSARLLLDKDGRSLDQVLAAIRWCQNDDFWRVNILSMPTLRKQYDRLRLAAIRKRSESHASGRNSDLGTDAHLQRYLERAKAREAEEAAGGLPANLWDRFRVLGEIAGGAA